MKYKCGHTKYTVIMNTNALTLAGYFEWKDSVGFDGDKTKCFDCWCKNQESKVKKDREVP